MVTRAAQAGPAFGVAVRDPIAQRALPRAPVRLTRMACEGASLRETSSPLCLKILHIANP
jgi:hypothetical protein